MDNKIVMVAITATIGVIVVAGVLVPILGDIDHYHTQEITVIKSNASVVDSYAAAVGSDSWSLEFSQDVYSIGYGDYSASISADNLPKTLVVSDSVCLFNNGTSMALAAADGTVRTDVGSVVCNGTAIIADGVSFDLPTYCYLTLGSGDAAAALGTFAIYDVASEARHNSDTTIIVSALDSAPGDGAGAWSTATAGQYSTGARGAGLAVDGTPGDGSCALVVTHEGKIYQISGGEVTL